MHETGPTGPSSQRPPVQRTLPPVRLPEQGEEVGVEALVAASQAAITARLEEGLRAINQSAARLMRQVAAEVWRAAGPDARKNLQTGVIGGLARDDAIRGVLSHMDERYQALHVEIARMEEALRRLAGATGRSLKRADGTAELVERVTKASQEQGRRTQADLAELARWIERTLEPISARLGALEAAAEAVATRQRTDLAAFTERTRQALARVGERLSQAFGVLREQTAAENRGALEALEAAIHQDFDRLERLSQEQAATSAEVAERISRSLLQLTERTVRALKGLRERIDSREEERVRVAEIPSPSDPPAAAAPSVPPEIDLEERLSGLRVSIDGLSVIAGDTAAEDTPDPEGTS
jgi:hypothetical protein